MARQLSLEEFSSPDYQLTGHLREVPHVGGATVRIFGGGDMTSTYQLIGHFLTLNRNINDFITFLEQWGTPAAHRAGLANAIAQRVQRAGVKIAVEVPKEIDGKPVSTKLDNDKANKIQRTRFNGDLRHDFPGCGFGNVGDVQPNQSLVNLREKGITNTDELFGAMLSHFDAAPTEAHMKSFWKALGHMRVAHGYKTTIIHAMKLKLDIGIDNCAARRLPPVQDAQPAPQTPEPVDQIPGSAQSLESAARDLAAQPALLAAAACLLEERQRQQQAAAAAATPPAPPRRQTRVPQQNVPQSPPPTPPVWGSPPTRQRRPAPEEPRSKLPTGLIVGAMAVGLVGIGYMMMGPAATSSAIAVLPRGGLAMEYE